MDGIGVWGMRPCRVERVRHVLLHAGNARRAHEIALRCTNDFQRGHCRSLCCSRRSPRARPVWRSLLTAPRALPGGGTQPIAPQGADRRGLPTSASPDPKTGTSPDARRAPTYHAATVLAAGMLARLRRAWYSNAFAPHPALSEVASRCPDAAHVWIGRLAWHWCANGAARICAFISGADIRGSGTETISNWRKAIAPAGRASDAKATIAPGVLQSLGRGVPWSR